MDVHFWRDVAIVVLSVEVFLFAIVPLVIMYMLIRGLRWGEAQVHVYALRARDAWRKVHRRVEHGVHIVRSPLELTYRLIHLFK